MSCPFAKQQQRVEPFEDEDYENNDDETYNEVEGEGEEVKEGFASMSWGWGGHDDPELYQVGEWVTMYDGSERIVKKKGKGGAHYFARPTNKEYKERERMLFGGGMAYDANDYQSYKAGEWVTRMDGSECVIKKVGKNKVCNNPTNADYKKRDRAMFGGNIPSYGSYGSYLPYGNYKDELAIGAALRDRVRRNRKPVYLQSMGSRSYVDDFALTNPHRRAMLARRGLYGGPNVHMPYWEYDYLMNKTAKAKAAKKTAAAGKE